MKVLMLGWEYPPHISGGLGTACAGLTAALAEKGVDIHFVVPQVQGDEAVSHMTFTNAAGLIAQQPEASMSGSEYIEITRVPAELYPYSNQQQFAELWKTRDVLGADNSQDEVYESINKELDDGEVFGANPSADSASQDLSNHCTHEAHQSIIGHHHTLFNEVERFTLDVLSRFSDDNFDLIHAHDWMTFPAAVALAQKTNRPLVAHVHSLEHDRSGMFYDREIDAIERFGVRSADKVVAVSHYTKRSIERNHLMPGDKIDVVHNGIYPRQVVGEYRQRKTWPKHVVLFLGRVTFQKGPDYFVEVASKVVPHISDILFVLAGSGDMLPAVQERVHELKLDQHFLFPGFVQGDELEELFSVADLYVMPSVSEPFGIAALEAISFNTPTILSKQSGVAEVIQHALKVDFWDIDRMADLIINSLTHSELRLELVENARQELSRLHWGVAAEKIISIYDELLIRRSKMAGVN